MENCVVCLVQFCSNEISPVKFTDEDSRNRQKISCVYQKILRIFCKYFNLPCKQNEKENENEGENPEENEILSSFPFCVECRNLVAELCIFHEKSESIHKIIQKTVAKISMKILETQEQNDRENSSNSDPLEKQENSKGTRNKMKLRYRRQILQNFNPRVHLTDCQSQNYNQNEENVPNEINSTTAIFENESSLNEESCRDNSKNNDNVAHDDYVDQNDSQSDSQDIEKETEKTSSLNSSSTSLQGNSASEKTRENLMQKVRAHFNRLANPPQTSAQKKTQRSGVKQGRRKKNSLENGILSCTIKSLGGGKFLYKNSWPFHIIENQELFECDTCQYQIRFPKNPQKQLFTAIRNHIREEHFTTANNSASTVAKKDKNGTTKTTFRFLDRWTFEKVDLGFKCGHCPKIYTKIRSMKLHIEIWHVPGKFKCSKCPQSCRSQGLLKRHRCGLNPPLNSRSYEIRPGSGKFVYIGKKQSWDFELIDGKFQCSSCPAFRRKKEHLTNHLREYHDALTTHMCEECGKIFPLKDSLTRHKLMHLKNTAQAKDKTDQPPAPKTPHVCPHCQKSCKGWTGLRVHIFRTHKDIPMTTTTAAENSTHLELKYPCGKCTRRFTSPVFLKKHEKIHEVLLICPKCEKEFQSREGFHTHMNRHNKVFKFFCDICNKGFLQKWQVTRHKETGVHSQKEETVKSKEASALKKGKRKRVAPDDSESSEQEEETESEAETTENESQDSEAATTEED